MFCVAVTAAEEENPREEKGLHARKSEGLGLADLLSRNCKAAIVESDDWVLFRYK